jgi:hypothetical protein
MRSLSFFTIRNPAGMAITPAPAHSAAGRTPLTGTGVVVQVLRTIAMVRTPSDEAGATVEREMGRKPVRAARPRRGPCRRGYPSQRPSPVPETDVVKA